MRKEGLNSSELDKLLRLEKEFQLPIENNYEVNNNESGGEVTRQIYAKHFEYIIFTNSRHLISISTTHNILFLF